MGEHINKTNPLPKRNSEGGEVEEKIACGGVSSTSNLECKPHFQIMFLLPTSANPEENPMVNSAGEHVCRDEKQNHVAWYNVHNTVNFLAGLGLLVKVGEFVSHAPYDQGMVISEKMIEWPIGFKEAWLYFSLGDRHFRGI